MKLTVFNGSPRGPGGNTRIIVDHVARGFESVEGNSSDLFYLNRISEADLFVQAFADAEAVLLAHPLYTDCMPGVVKAFIETLAPFCGRDGNPAMAFIVQSGFPEAAHSRYVERYYVRLAERLGCPFAGLAVRGNCEGIRLRPESASKVLDGFQRLGRTFGETGRFDPSLVQELAGPERMGAPLRLLVALLTRTKVGTAYWDNQLRGNGAYEDRFARPYADPDLVR
jgi:hypothetical protein